MESAEKILNSTLNTKCTKADCKETIYLMQGIATDILLADHSYDVDEIIAYVLDVGIKVISPSNQNCKEECKYDHYLYPLCHLVEGIFLRTKRWNCRKVCK